MTFIFLASLQNPIEKPFLGQGQQRRMIVRRFSMLGYLVRDRSGWQFKGNGWGDTAGF
jgi:hypothetical protein